MGTRVEWTMSLFLRADVPAAYVAELRWMLGLDGERPADAELSHSHPSLAAHGASELPGGDLVRLVEQPTYGGGHQLGLHFRLLLGDDAVADGLGVLPPWLVRHSATDGWVGWMRQEDGLAPWLTFFADDRVCYVAGPGEEPVPYPPASGPFARHWTSHGGDQGDR